MNLDEIRDTLDRRQSLVEALADDRAEVRTQIIDTLRQYPSNKTRTALDQYWEETARNKAINLLFDDYEKSGHGREILENIAVAVINEMPVSSWRLHVSVMARCLENQEIDMPDAAHLKTVDHRPLKTKMAGIAR